MLVHPLRVLPRFRRAYRELEALAERETWTRAELDSWQLDRINRIWSTAVNNAPHYRELRREHGLPYEFGSLAEFQERVPCLKKEDIQPNPRRLLSDRPSPGTWFRTGGSTGAPLEIYRTREAHLQRLWPQYRFWQSWNIDVFDRAVHLWGHRASAQKGFRGHRDALLLPMWDGLRRRLRLSAYALSGDVLRGYLAQIQRFRPKVIYAYSTAALLLAREALATDFRCESLRGVVLTAEPAYPSIVATVEKAFQVPALIEYGSIETGFLAGEARDRTLRPREDFVHFETLPREDGRYDIVVSCLTNADFPLLRYRIGDVTSAPLEIPERGFAILQDVAGRSNQMLRSRTGRYLHGTWFEVIMEEYPAIRRYRMHQSKEGALRVDLELEGPLAADQRRSICDRLGEHLEGWPVEIETSQSLENSRSGKHVWITSDLDHASAVERQHA